MTMTIQRIFKILKYCQQANRITVVNNDEYSDVYIDGKHMLVYDDGTINQVMYLDGEWSLWARQGN